MMLRIRLVPIAMLLALLLLASALGQKQADKDSLILALKDNNSGDRVQAAIALGELKDPRAKDPLIQALKDQDRMVRWEAQLALGEINDTQASSAVLHEPENVSPNEFNSSLNYDYAEIDRHALKAPPSAETSIRNLSSYLIAPAKDDRERARAIFRWITENIDYNVDGYFSGSYSEVNPQGLLKDRKSVCEGYANLFQALADEAGLTTTTINGYGKGIGYYPGEILSGPANHTWNAIKINGSWYLIDCTWGAGYIDENRTYVRRFDDHYFMTPPCQFIYDHLPFDPRYQLLKHPLSKSDFEKLVYLKSDFFNYNFRIGSNLQSVIETENALNITIFAPREILLIADIVDQVPALSSEKTLDNFVFSQRQGNRYDIHVSFPSSGEYLLRVYAKDKKELGAYNEVFECKIEAGSINRGSIGFPKTFGKFTEAGAFLYAPMKGELKVGIPQEFKLIVPDAEDVAVVNGEKWSHLKAHGGLFEGNVTLSEGDINVYAKFHGQELYDCLLRYVAF